MFDKEIFITPLFKVWVVSRIVLVTGLFKLRMEVDGIFFVEIRGREIATTTEPPNALPFLVSHFEVAEVKMHGWSVWVQLQHTTKFVTTSSHYTYLFICWLFEEFQR